jgi:hypothetical protein
VTYRSSPPRPSAVVDLRAFATARFVVPLLALAAGALLAAFAVVVRSRASLVITPYAAQEVPGAVASFEWRTGVLALFGSESTGELQDFYGQARVVGTNVVLSDPLPSSLEPPPTVSLGFEPETFGSSDERIARRVEEWMRGPRARPLRLVWWTTPEPSAIAFAGLAGFLLFVVGFAATSRVRVAFDDSLVHVESRHAFGARTASFARNEIRKVTVESRVLGPFVFARPLLLTNEGRRIPIGPATLTDGAAADFAQRIRALVG